MILSACSCSDPANDDLDGGELADGRRDGSGLVVSGWERDFVPAGRPLEPSTGANQHFGHSLSLSADGDTLAVGAPVQWLGGCAPARGTVAIYDRVDGAWQLVAALDPPDSEGELFGNNVELSGDGDSLAVTDDSYENSRVHLYRRLDEWTWVQTLKWGPRDVLGGALAFSRDGQTLAVGAPGHGWPEFCRDGVDCSGEHLPVGAVRVFLRSEAGEWEEEAVLSASNGDPGDFFGGSLSLTPDGSRLVIAAAQEDGLLDEATECSTGAECENDSWSETGALYVFERAPEGWAEVGYLKGASRTDLLGYRVQASSAGDVVFALSSTAAHMFHRGEATLSEFAWTERQPSETQSQRIAELTETGSVSVTATVGLLHSTLMVRAEADGSWPVVQTIPHEGHLGEAELSADGHLLVVAVQQDSRDCGDTPPPYDILTFER